MLPTPSALFSCLALTAMASATPVIRVTSPAPFQVSSPVHYVASATSPGCAKGIAALRIYLAPHLAALTVHSSTLDAELPLSPGNYNTVVQAWDNCGGIAKAPINFTVAATGLRPARFLYLTTSSSENQRVFGYVINAQTGALIPTHQRSVSGVAGAFALASDQGAYRLYVMPFARFTNDDNAATYFIDRRNGTLSSVPGSPSFVGFAVRTVAVHPSGKFIFAGTVDQGVASPGILVFRVNRNGSLTLLTSGPVLTDSDAISLAINPDGKFLYVTSGSSIDAFAINQTTGALAPLAGSPFAVETGCASQTTDSLADVFGRSLYVTTTENLAVSAFAINGSTGSLHEIGGSPFLDPPFPDTTGKNCDGQITSLAAESTGRFLFAGKPDGAISIFAINAGDGSLRHLKNTPVNYGDYSGGPLAPDPAGRFLYTFGNSTPPGPNPLNEVIGFAINQSTGDLTVLPTSPTPIPTGLAQGFRLVVTP